MEAKNFKAVEKKAQNQVETRKAPANGVFPEDFYVTTNRETHVNYQGRWLKVEGEQMDCAVTIRDNKAVAVSMQEVKKGEEIIVGSKGVKVKASTATKTGKKEDEFCFMNSEISAEKSKGEKITSIAREMQKLKNSGGNITLVGGPAIVHTGAGNFLADLIKHGYINNLLAGNALAVHDIESALFGTSLDCPVNNSSNKQDSQHFSHNRELRGMHMRAINKIRAAGSIKKAVESGVLQQGIMYEAVKNDIDFVLAGSIRDDGPLPDTITDTLKAQEKMEKIAQNSDLVLMLATMLHSIATGNLMPARVKSVCVDINTDTVTKLSDRGSSQALGLVTDVELFLQSLAAKLGL